MAGRFKIILLSTLLLLAALAPAEARPVKILALGTSLTQGYGLPPGTEFTTQLQAALKAAGLDAAVTNAGDPLSVEVGSTLLPDPVGCAVGSIVGAV